MWTWTHTVYSIRTRAQNVVSLLVICFRRVRRWRLFEMELRSAAVELRLNNQSRDDSVLAFDLA